jgi:hypothetical protein
MGSTYTQHATTGLPIPSTIRVSSVTAVSGEGWHKQQQTNTNRGGFVFRCALVEGRRADAWERGIFFSYVFAGLFCRNFQFSDHHTTFFACRHCTDWTVEKLVRWDACHQTASMIAIYFTSLASADERGNSSPWCGRRGAYYLLLHPLFCL